MKQIVIAALVTVSLAGCLAKKESTQALKTGTWRATIEIQGQLLPFNLDIEKDKADGYDVYLRNAEERLLLDEVTVTGDSVDIVLHVFDADIKARIKGDTLQGEFIKNYEKDYNLPFVAVYGQKYRFEKGNQQDNIPDFSGKYAVNFIHETDTTVAVGIFKQTGDSVTGTFLTPTGDYRYLQGNVANGMMQLSTFDGNHAYIFTATKSPDGKLMGEYYSGKTWMEFWVAEKNDNAVLPDAEKLTYLKQGYETVSFTFPDVNGNKVSLTDEKYKNKVVILQLFGTWCPNCMDETAYMVNYYKKYHNKGVEVIGLAYERTTDFEKSKKALLQVKDRFKVTYPLLITGYTSDKQQTAQSLPMLSKVVGFPTTIIIDKSGDVQKIHTGFSGPGTGEHYTEFISEFEKLTDDLLVAPPAP